MAQSIASEFAHDAHVPRRAYGSGKIIRGDSYGHVDVVAIPRTDTGEVSVEAGRLAFGHGIPAEEQDSVTSAARRLLEAAAAAGSLRCGVHVIIEHGSFHPESRSAHAEATENAIRDALRRGRFTSEV